MEKAQSAMEYLITYSWAIIIITITLGALYALGLFNPTSFVTSECIFPADFGCLSSFFYGNGTLIINLQQSTTSSVTVTAIGCNNAAVIPSNGPPTYAPIDPNSPISMPIGSNWTFNMSCYSNGTVFTSQPGTLYRGYVVINYTNLQTGFPHVLVGKIIEKSS